MSARKPSLGIRILSCYIAWSFFMAPLAVLAEPVAALDDGVSGAEARDPLPPGSLTIGALYTEDYWEGIGDVLVPLYFDGQGLFFVNPRTSRTDNDASEFNIGLGYRRLIREREAIVGGNLYYDYRDTTAGAQFHQIGAGLEYLSKRLDLRANIYAPTETREKVNEFATTETSTSRSASREIRADYGDPYATGYSVLQDYEQISLTRTTTTTLTTTRFYDQYEIAFWGWDAEIGTEWSIPGLDDLVRIKPFAGVVNYYGRSGVSDIAAFRGRLEVHIGPSFFLDAVYLSDDSLNGGNFAAGAYLSLPFEIGNIAQGRNPFARATEAPYVGSGRDVSWRLGEIVKRDPQIRATVAAPEERKDKLTSTTETTRSTSTEDLGTGTAVILADVTFVNNENAASTDQDGTAENPYDSVQDGVDNANSPVWVYTGNAPYEENVEVPEGVQLYGQGTTIQALGGKTWGGGTHPVVVGQNDAPVIRILGNNTAVSGFDIRHSSTAGEVVIDPVTSKDVTLAGVYGSKVSNFEIHDNIMTNGSLSYGIFIANNGSVTADLIGSFLGNTIQNVSEDGLYVYGDGSGTFDVGGSGNYSLNNNGIRLVANGYDVASARLRDITANNNSLNGMDTISVNANGDGSDAIVDLQNVTASNNGGNGIGEISARAYGENADAVITLQDVTANNNTNRGISTIRSYSQEGGARVDLAGVNANDNKGSGIQQIVAEARGAGSDATVVLNNLQANNNNGYAIYAVTAVASGAARDAILEVNNIQANYNTNAGIEYAGASSQGIGGNASTTLNNVETSNNQENGVGRVYANANNGAARVDLTDVTANDNGGRGIYEILADAYGENDDAVITLQDVTANNNTHSGINSIKSYSQKGCARVDLADVNANDNKDYGIKQITAMTRGDGSDATVVLNNLQANNNLSAIYEVIADAYGADGDAILEMNNIQANYNTSDGIQNAKASSHGINGNASITLNTVETSNNQDNGVRSVEAYAFDGAATVNMSGMTSRSNTLFGVYNVTATAGGAGDDAEITFIDSDLRDNTSSTNTLNAIATGIGGNATIYIDNVIE